MSAPPANSLPRFDVAMLGARRNYVVPRALASVGMLETFYTDIYLGNPALRGLLNSLPPKLTPAPLRRLQGRYHPELPRRNVVSFNLVGLQENLRRRRARSFTDLLQHFADSGRMFCEAILRQGELRGAGLYAVCGGALELCLDAQQRGVPTLLDQNVAPFRFYNRLAKEECERWPGWQQDLLETPEDNPFSPREEAEWQSATRILAPSEYIARELVHAGVEANKIRVLPFCWKETGEQTAHRRDRAVSRELHVLFVGGASLMKGLPYLLEALRLLNSRLFKCQVVGSIEVDPARLAPYSQHATFVGHVPRTEMTQFYRWADVLVFPTLSDSFGMVQLEAMAHAVPVIATPNAGSVVRDGVDGFVVPIRDPEAIAAHIERLSTYPTLLRVLAENAKSRVNDFNFRAYTKAVARHISDVLPMRLVEVESLRSDEDEVQVSG